MSASDDGRALEAWLEAMILAGEEEREQFNNNGNATMTVANSGTQTRAGETGRCRCGILRGGGGPRESAVETVGGPGTRGTGRNQDRRRSM